MNYKLNLNQLYEIFNQFPKRSLGILTDFRINNYQALGIPTSKEIPSKFKTNEANKQKLTPSFNIPN